MYNETGGEEGIVKIQYYSILSYVPRESDVNDHKYVKP
jgi:hypothetical protein